MPNCCGTEQRIEEQATNEQKCKGCFKMNSFVAALLLYSKKIKLFQESPCPAVLGIFGAAASDTSKLLTRYRPAAEDNGRLRAIRGPGLLLSVFSESESDP